MAKLCPDRKYELSNGQQQQAISIYSFLEGLGFIEIVKGLGAKVLCESFVRKFCAKVLCESFGRKFWAVFFLEPHFESGAGCWVGLGGGVGLAGLGWKVGCVGWGGRLGLGAGLGCGLDCWAGLSGLGWAGLGWAGLGWAGLGWVVLGLLPFVGLGDRAGRLAGWENS